MSWRRGSPRERAVAGLLRELGYLIASRRHEGGAGDLLALAPHYPARELEPLLVEVKGTSDLPWRSDFTPSRREELVETAEWYGAEPLLAWWPPGLGAPIWLPPEDWPASKPGP